MTHQVTFEKAKEVAEEKGLDATKLFVALSWLEPKSEAEATPERVDVLQQALGGKFNVLPSGAIMMHDKQNPLRHRLDEYYTSAQ